MTGEGKRGGRILFPTMGKGIVQGVEDTRPVFRGNQGGGNVEGAFNPGILDLELPDYHGTLSTGAPTSSFDGGYLEGLTQE